MVNIIKLLEEMGKFFIVVIDHSVERCDLSDVSVDFQGTWRGCTCCSTWLVQLFRSSQCGSCRPVFLFSFNHSLKASRCLCTFWDWISCGTSSRAEAWPRSAQRGADLGVAGGVLHNVRHPLLQAIAMVLTDLGPELITSFVFFQGLDQVRHVWRAARILASW